MLLAGFLAKRPQNHNITHILIISVPFNAEATLLESEKIQNVLMNKHIVQCILKIFKRYDSIASKQKLNIFIHYFLFLPKNEVGHVFLTVKGKKCLRINWVTSGCLFDSTQFAML
jgi:hypothetical protein